MPIKIYRTILEHSNPRVVREFQIDDNRTYLDLVKTVALVHGWTTSSENVAKVLRELEGSSLGNRKISELMAADKGIDSEGIDFIKINYPFRNHYGEEEGVFWTFRMEEIQGSENKQEPLLLYADGLNPMDRCINLSQWNGLHYNILGGNHDYAYSSLGPLAIEDQTPDFNTVNKRLNHQIRLGRQEIKLSKSRADSLKDIFSSHTQSDLVQMAKVRNIVIKPNLRKAEFLRQLAERLNKPEIWDKILEEMSLGEYEDLIDICNGTYAQSEIFIFPLENYCMIAHSAGYWNQDKIPLELLEYYVKLVYEGRETELHQSKRFDNVLEACRCLYAVFSIKQAKKIADIMYPGLFTDQNLPTYWKESEHNKLLQPDVMYSSLNLTENSARSLYRQLERMKVPYYVPDKEELFRLAEEGFSFPPAIQNKLITQLRRMMSYYSEAEAVMITSAIYEMYHLGWDKASVKKQLKAGFYLTGSDSSFNNLLQVVESNKSKIRMISRRGNTI